MIREDRYIEDQITELVASALIYFERLDKSLPNCEFLHGGAGWQARCYNDSMFNAKVRLLTTKIMGVIES